MHNYDPTKLREMRKAYFLVHPFWGYYVGGTVKRAGNDYVYDPIKQPQLYAKILEREWGDRDLPKVLGKKEVDLKTQELEDRVMRGEITPYVADIKFREFVGSFLRKATSQNVEAYAKRVDERYRSAIEEAVAKKDSIFVIVTTTATEAKSSKPRLALRTLEFELAKFARRKLGRRAIIIQEQFKPVAFFQIMTSRGFALARNAEIEAMGEMARIGKGFENKQGWACVQAQLKAFVESIPTMSEHVKKGTIFEQKEMLPKAESFFTVRGLETEHVTVLKYPDGRTVRVEPQPEPKWMKVRKRRPLRFFSKKPIYWVNLSRSGIPLRGLPRFARKLRKK